MPVLAFLSSAVALRTPQVDLEKTQDELLDDVHQRIRKAKVDGGLVPPNPSKGKRLLSRRRGEECKECLRRY